jgi:hypothetical protein
MTPPNPPLYPVAEVKIMVLAALQSGDAVPQGGIYYSMPLMVRYAHFETALSELMDDGQILKIDQPNGVPDYRLSPNKILLNE